MELQSQDAPPPTDEGYWAALMKEDNRGDEEKPVQEEKEDVWAGVQGLDFETSFANGHSQSASQHDWQRARTVFDQDQTVELEVIGHNRGGLLVVWDDLRGFVPASQLVDFPVDIDEDDRMDALARREGERLLLRIIELDETKNRLILSERAAQVGAGERAGLLDQLEPGQTCEGMITNLVDFGAFVDLGGIEGLIHISEISWGRIGHPRDVLDSGAEVKVYVISVEPEEGRIALSLKRLQPDPWQSVEKKYQVGEWVEGVVTNVVDFGAFACIEDGLEGLIHVSELAEGQFLHPRNVVGEGDKVKARILNIDSDHRRLGLSLRRFEENSGDSTTTVITHNSLF